MEVAALLFLFLLIFGSLALLVVDRRQNASNQRQVAQRKREQSFAQTHKKVREQQRNLREAEQGQPERKGRSNKPGTAAYGGRAAPARPPSKTRPDMEDWEDPFAGRVRTIPSAPKELRALPYGEYLQTPHWKRKREEKLRAVGRRCQVCNQGPGPLDVHHRTYERLGEELDVDLTALCRSCHHLFHEHGRLSR